VSTFKLGLDGKFYRGAAGTTASTLVENVKDVTLSIEKGTADITRRKSGKWRSTKTTLMDGTLEWEMVWDPDDADIVAIKDAFFNDTPIALAVFDAAPPDGKGLDADFVITKFGRNEPLEEGMTVPVEAKPNDELRIPDWID